MKILKHLNKNNKFIQKNSLDKTLNQTVQGKDFLQSSEWREFQESVGKKVFNIHRDGFDASTIEHELLLVGKYFYVPRGPIFSTKVEKIPNQPLISNNKIENTGFWKLIELAKEKKAGWIRVDITNKKILELIQGLIQGFDLKIIKAPHDMQPRQIFKIDISKGEEELLAEMKPKTRYNIRLADRKGVIIKEGKEYIDEFLRLVKLTSKRQGIVPHSDDYYRKMIDIQNVKLCVAEFEGKIIAANLMFFYGETITYLHGASDNNYRNVMAPFLLQWQAILDAKKKGCLFYDFGGIKTQNTKHKTQNNWAGITRFKLSFSKDTSPLDFLGSYDIVISPFRYAIYRFLQRIKSVL